MSSLAHIQNHNKFYIMIRLFSLLAILICSTTLSFGQNKKETLTEKIKVQGVCDQCKKRIEDAAYIPGVRRADWDKSSKVLTVTYRSPKTSLEEIDKNIAKSGHTTEFTKADDSVYANLPSCCAYNEREDH